MKKAFKIILIILAVIAAAVIAFIAWLSITEYSPEPLEEVPISGSNTGKAAIGQELNIMTWNIGYCGLGKDSDFFMDGGKQVQPSDRSYVEYCLNGIKSFLNETEADLFLLQEVDTDSKRCYGINEAEQLEMGASAHALNFSCRFVPYPLPMIGRVSSGLMTTSSSLELISAERISLPSPFSWPVSMANLKRCLLVTRIPVEGSDKELVIINLHLEAYDDGEGKLAQTEQLMKYIEQEYKKGNYVIAGGDFNQSFPNGLAVYPNTHGELWMPSTLDESLLPEGCSFAYDTDTPTCRLLNQSYNPDDTENTQYYVIDGFILSPNVELVAVETIDLGFEYSDHNPVSIRVILK